MNASSESTLLSAAASSRTSPASGEVEAWAEAAVSERMAA